MKKLFSSFLFSFLFFSLFFPVFARAELININTADFVKLKDIPWIGDDKAQNIIDYREQNGLFNKIEEVMNVNGIKSGTFEKIKGYITVGSVSSDNSTNVQTPDTDDMSSEDNFGSVITSSAEISDYKKEGLKIGAGKDRLATVRTPVLFVASQNKKGKNDNFFTWSFGDGMVAYGSKVCHSYQFPGNYNVVLNGRIDQDEEAISRVTVQVVDSKIKIKSIDSELGFVEIINDSDKEQNLNSWKLNLGNESYSIPIDTIINPKTTIKIPVKFLGFDLTKIEKITLAYPDGGVVSRASLQTENNSPKILEIKNKLSLLKKELANQETKNQQIAPITEKIKKTENESIDVITLKKESGLIEKIKNAIFK